MLIVLLAATGSMLPVCSTRQKDPVGTCQYASKFDSLKARNLAITQVPGRERESKQSSVAVLLILVATSPKGLVLRVYWVWRLRHWTIWEKDLGVPPAALHLNNW